MPTIETVRGLTEPTVAGDTNLWGGELNTTIAALAGILGTAITFPSSTYGSAATLTSSQAQAARLLVNNTSSAPFQLNLPSSNFANGGYLVSYTSSQVQALTVTGGSSVVGGQTVTINSTVPVGTVPAPSRLVYSDGLGNVFLADNLTAASSGVVTSIGGTQGAVTLGGGLSVSGSTLSAIQTQPTAQFFTSGSTAAYVPTSSSVLRARVRICGGGGGGGGGGPGATAGSSGGQTSFGLSSSPWTAQPGLGGASGNTAGSGGSGGTGGGNGAPGNLISRFPGGAGQGGFPDGFGSGGIGGANPFGGGGGGQPNVGSSGAGNTGGGGGGGGTGNVNNNGAGGGAGEYAEFWISPVSSAIVYTIGAGGAAGSAGASGFAGGPGAPGCVIVEEFYV